VIVHDFDLVGVSISPDEADAPLVVDANAVLPRSIVLQCLEPVPRRNPQGIKSRRGVQLRQLAPCHGMQSGWQPAHNLPGKNPGCILVREGLDHKRILTLPVIIGKSRSRRLLVLLRGTASSVPVRRYAHAASEADFVVLCLPHTPETRHIINAAAFDAMKPTACLINVSRGALIDEPALIAAMRAGRIAGAGLDVTTVDPIPRESPLWDLPNTIITPHIATESVKLSDAVVDFWCENLRRFAENQPLLGVVDRRASY